MKRTSWIGAVSALTVLVALIPSCQRQGGVMRERVVVTAIGIDATADGCALSVQAVQSLKAAAGAGEQNENATAVYTAAGSSVSTALHAFLDETGRQTYILQNQLIAVSLDGCRARSLFETLDYFIRYPNGRVAVPLCVSRGDPAQLLALESGSDAIPARYLAGLLRENANGGRAVYRTLLDTERAASGMWDAVLPILAVQDGKAVADGTLLFRNGVAAGELDAQQTQGLAVLLGEAQRVLYTVNGVTYEVTPRSPAVRIAQRTITFEIGGQVRVTETVGNAAPDVAAVTARLTADAKAALAALDAADCDPLGLARRMAQSDPRITQKTARSQLSACDKTVLVALTFTE